MRLWPEAPAKKPYQQPKLIIYGNLTEMTLAGAAKGTIDSRGTGNVKTAKKTF
jgi:hypothetical protein